MQVFWHRDDLRRTDNVGLTAAADGGEPVQPLIIDDAARDAERGRRAAELHRRGMAALVTSYRADDIKVVCAAGDPAEVIDGFVGEQPATVVHCNRVDTPVGRARTDAVAAVCTARGIDLEVHVDHVLVDPATLASSYPSYSAFRRAWQREPIIEPTAAPPAGAFDGIDRGAPSERVGAAIDLPTAGEAAAMAQLDAFVTTALPAYADRRDDLEGAVADAIGPVSELSPYLARGMIGARTVYAAAAPGDDRGARKFRDELCWREFYQHLLFHNPQLPFEDYRTDQGAIAWREDEPGLAAWMAGMTGYPLVDAGMRQLAERGYIHNRPRQVAASFLCKHLLVDWRVGMAHFADLLTDHDVASNAGNWQWIGSTGTDTVRCRIFDPVAQARKYDPTGAFIRRWVPELRALETDAIINWPTLEAAQREQLAPSYAHPIVDRDAAYDRAQRVVTAAVESQQTG